MCLGALVDAGLAPEDLEAALAGVPLGGYRLHIERVRRGPVAGTRVRVEVEEPQPARPARELLALLEESRLPPTVAARSREVFFRLARAEAKVHGLPPEEVHFHEVGGVDAVVDVVGTVAGLELLGVEELWASPLPCPRGWVEAAHGPLPLPAPAVMELLCGAPVYGVEEEAELVTPTGAALAVTLAAGFGPLPAMRPLRIGYGAGTREGARPNLLRLIVGERAAATAGETAEEVVAVLETALDDMNPEFCAYVAERLRDEGARDVFFTSVAMKKGRPGILVTALVPPERLEETVRILFAETTTLGVRWRLENRVAAARGHLVVPVHGREVRVKWGRLGPQDAVQLSPEYEDCRVLARESGLPLKEVYFRARAEARRLLGSARETRGETGPRPGLLSEGD